MDKKKLNQNKFKIIYVPTDVLKPSEYNPRKISNESMEQLKESIRRFQVVDPVIANAAQNRKNVLIGGHMRLRAAKELGLEEIPVIYVDIPDLEKEKELNLRLNRNTGEFDWNLLAEFDENLLRNVGFTPEELDNVFGIDIDEEFDVDRELRKVLASGPRRVKDGDVWRLGSHRLAIGDCIEKKNWQKVLGNEKFDFLFSDPPYRLAYARRLRKIQTKDGPKLKQDKLYLSVGETDCKGRFKGYVKTKKGFGYRAQRSYLGVEKRGGVPEYDEWLSIANEFQNPQGANVMIFENWKNVVDLWQAMEKYWKICNLVIWFLPNRSQGFSKPHFFFNKYDVAPLAGNGVRDEVYEAELDDYLQERGQKLLDSYEVILYGQKGKSYWDRKKNTPWAKVSDHITWTADNAKASGQNLIFGTKPIPVLTPFVKILSPREGIVMEPFAGSGSTLVACEIMKRKCRAIEIEPIYAEIILARWERFTGMKAEKIN